MAQRRTKCDWAEQIRTLPDVQYPRAVRVTLVLDNLNTHSLVSLYEAFEPAEARRLIERLEVVYAPKHGSWLNMAEIELGVLTRSYPKTPVAPVCYWCFSRFGIASRQCMGGRVPDQATLAASVDRWQKDRNANRATQA